MPSLQEYTVGIGGRLPANLINFVQIRQQRAKYYCRKIFWDEILIMVERVDSVYNATTAIDAIYEKYGRECSVSAIIQNIRNDRMTIPVLSYDFNSKKFT